MEIVSVMKNGSNNRLAPTPVESAIVAKWALQEAWLTCLDIIDQRHKDGLLSNEKKAKLQAMYTAFFSQAFYASIKTRSDVDELVINSKKMLRMLRDLDKSAWETLCVSPDDERHLQGNSVTIDE